MSQEITYGRLQPEEAQRAMEMVLAVFSRHVAPEFSAQGIDEFRRHANVEALQTRLQQGSTVFVGRQGEHIVGLAEVRDHAHLALLFVDAGAQGQGIGRALLRLATDLCRTHDGASLTVNASPNALAFYRSMGFVAQGEETLKNGIRFTPMRLDWSAG